MLRKKFIYSTKYKKNIIIFSYMLIQEQKESRYIIWPLYQLLKILYPAVLESIFLALLVVSPISSLLAASCVHETTSPYCSVSCLLQAVCMKQQAHIALCCACYKLCAWNNKPVLLCVVLATCLVIPDYLPPYSRMGPGETAPSPHSKS